MWIPAVDLENVLVQLRNFVAPDEFSIFLRYCNHNNQRLNSRFRYDLQGSLRVARPPGEGRGRNQLLPRYWPRITDQELKQINSGEYPF